MDWKASRVSVKLSLVSVLPPPPAAVEVVVVAEVANCGLMLVGGGSSVCWRGCARARGYADVRITAAVHAQEAAAAAAAVEVVVVERRITAARGAIAVAVAAAAATLPARITSKRGWWCMGGMEDGCWVLGEEERKRGRGKRERE